MSLRDVLKDCKGKKLQAVIEALEEAASSDHEAGDEPGKHVLLTKQQYMDFTCATEESYKDLVLKYKKISGCIEEEAHSEEAIG